MRDRWLTIRPGARRALVLTLGEHRARRLYDALSATRELAWNSWRRRFYPSFWRRAFDGIRTGVRRYAVHGEFGDAVLALPFLFREHQRHPKDLIRVVFRSAASGTAERTARDYFAERGLRVMVDGSGRNVSFLAEFWAKLPFVEAADGDVTDARHQYWQPQPAFTLFGESRSPRDYAPFIEGLFTPEDRAAAAALGARSSRPLRIVAHLRRSAREIAALIASLETSPIANSIALTVVGSRKHEAIPDIACRAIEVIDLTDNYEQGVPIGALLQHIRDADLFIGGRGGFEIFALAAGVPALTIFDDDGWWERRRLWPPDLWRHNPLGAFYRARHFDAQRALDESVTPWLEARLGRGREQRFGGEAA